MVINIIAAFIRECRIKGIAQPDELRTSSFDAENQGTNRELRPRKEGRIRRVENGSGKM